MVRAHSAAGEKQGKSLLARDAPSVWYEAAADLPPLPAPAVQAAAANTLSEAEFEAKKQAAIAALQNEEAVFEKDLGMPVTTFSSFPKGLHCCVSPWNLLSALALQHR